jgi:hypothetical protein
MDANDVIDSYVHDVARRLPLGKRGDVAFELRALLTDDLRARADAEGRPPDFDMAVSLLRAFGRPADVAIRYYRAFTIIGPSDTWNFLVAALAGGALVGLLASFARGSMPSNELSQRADAAFLGWLGALVVVFGVKSLVLRYRPDAFGWRPRPVRDGDQTNRVALVGLTLLWSASLVLYLMPGRVVELLSGGRVAAGTLAYSDSFTSPWRMAWLVGLVAVAIGLQVVVAVRGRWHTSTRWASLAVTSLIGVQLGWHASYGSIFHDPQVDRFAVPVTAWLSALVLVTFGIMLYREYNRVRPAPASA